MATAQRMASGSGDGWGRREVQELIGAFKSVMATVRRLRGRDTHRPGELSYAQYGLLFGLADGQARPAGELASAADLSPASATQMLERLEAAGLVERMRCERDRRVVQCALTPRGREVIEERRAKFEPLWLEALSDFSDDELRTATAVLQRLSAMFESFSEE